LDTLNQWVFTLGELGLAPLHPQGAYGNHSYRVSEKSFVITRTGMCPGKDLRPENYCLVCYDEKEDLFDVTGEFDPSSECFLHHSIYRHLPGINTIMHGHSTLLNVHANDLHLPVTLEEYPYGTKELAHSAVQLVTKEYSFFIMKNHGFVATGEDMNGTGIMVLRQYKRLLDLLLTNSRPQSPVVSD
jgi:ribulose-5-phosphate 4-epimerase/fuculose-1-phosphate aldolase